MAIIWTMPGDPVQDTLPLPPVFSKEQYERACFMVRDDSRFRYCAGLPLLPYAEALWDAAWQIFTEDNKESA